jgi:hypothetical protein
MRPNAGPLQRSKHIIKKDLIISLFVHDNKAPLAVIDVGTRSLSGHTDRQVPLSHEQIDLLHEIIEMRNLAVSVLNRVLGVGQSKKTDRPIVNSGSLRRLFQTLIKWVSRFLKRPESLLQFASPFQLWMNSRRFFYPSQKT